MLVYIIIFVCSHFEGRVPEVWLLFAVPSVLSSPVGRLGWVEGIDIN